MKYGEQKIIRFSDVLLKLCFALSSIKIVVKMFNIYNFNDALGIKNYISLISMWTTYTHTYIYTHQKYYCKILEISFY